jgi:hypothetical protein
VLVTKRFPWKGSYRSIPDSIKAVLEKISTDLVIVAATKKIPVEHIRAGQYVHLGMSFDGTNLNFPAIIVPDESVGKYASRNKCGWEVKRTDLPMVTKTYVWETPNFGDAATYGTHLHSQDRDVYQVQIFEPRMFPIKIELLNEPGASQALFKFEVGQVLDRKSPLFDDDLLFCLNLLQESTGVASVYASDSTQEDFIGTIHLDWEVFPPGTADKVIEALAKGRGGLPSKIAGIVAARIRLFNKLPVKHIIRGTGSFAAYIGALYADDLVVFENMTYGNALYILYDDWKDVSKRSRLELLRGTSAKYDRIVHSNGWEERFEEMIGKELEKRGILARKRQSPNWRW